MNAGRWSRCLNLLARMQMLVGIRTDMVLGDSRKRLMVSAMADMQVLAGPRRTLCSCRWSGPQGNRGDLGGGV